MRSGAHAATGSRRAENRGQGQVQTEQFPWGDSQEFLFGGRCKGFLREANTVAQAVDRGAVVAELVYKQRLVVGLSAPAVFRVARWMWYRMGLVASGEMSRFLLVGELEDMVKKNWWAVSSGQVLSVAEMALVTEVMGESMGAEFERSCRKITAEAEAPRGEAAEAVPKEPGTNSRSRRKQQREQKRLAQVAEAVEAARAEAAEAAQVQEQENVTDYFYRQIFWGMEFGIGGQPADC